MKLIPLAFAAAFAGSIPAFAQTAEGSYPGTLFCEATAGTEPVRVPLTVEIVAGRASYSVTLDGGTETGGGTLSGGGLMLTGQAGGRRGYAARYSGQVSGRGGLLTGTQTGRGFKRPCQISIGQGRA